MTIGDLSARTNVPASTIRYWESIGVLPAPARVSGRRTYTPSAVDLIVVLKLAQACGFSLDEMRRLIHGFRPDIPASRRWQELARGKQAEVERKIAELQAMRTLLGKVSRCTCADLQQCARIAASPR